MGGEEFDAEFERLGEVEVIDRIIHNSYEQYMRAYALRWLANRAMARVLAQEEAVASARLAELAHTQRSRVLLIFALILICVVLAGAFLVNIRRAARVNAGHAQAHGVHAPTAAALRPALARAS
jgi:hypothetical protein